MERWPFLKLLKDNILAYWWAGCIVEDESSYVTVAYWWVGCIVEDELSYVTVAYWWAGCIVEDESSYVTVAYWCAGCIVGDKSFVGGCGYPDKVFIVQLEAKL